MEFKDKINQSVAAAVAKIMGEALHPNQQQVDEGTMTGITLGAKVKNKQGGYNQDVHHKGEKIGHIEAYKHRSGMRYGAHHHASGDATAGNRDAEESIADIRYSHAEHLRSMKNEEVENLDEVSLKTATSAYVKRMGKDDDKSPVKAVKTMDHIAKKHGVVGVARAAKAADKEYGLNDPVHNKRKDFVKGVMAGVKEEVEQLDESDIENGYKIRMKHIDKGRIHSPSGEHVADVTREHGEGWRYHSGGKNWDGSETSKHYKTGVEKTKAAAARKAVQHHMTEQVELDEVKMADLPSTKVQGRSYGASKPEPHAVDVLDEPTDRALKSIESEKKKKPVNEEDAYDKNVKPSDKPHDKDAAKKRAQTSAVAARKIMSMSAYSAKKNAMKEEKEDHHQKGYDHVREPISDEPYLDNARERFNELKKQNPHKKGSQEHKDWHSGASAAYEEHKDILRGN